MDWCPVLVPSVRSILKHPVDKLGPVEISKTVPRPTLVPRLHFVNVGSKEPVKWVPVLLFSPSEFIFHKEFEDWQISRFSSPDHEKGEAGVDDLLQVVQINQGVKLAQMVVLFSK